MQSNTVELQQISLRYSPVLTQDVFSIQVCDHLLGSKIYCCCIQSLEQADLQPQNAQGTDTTKSEDSKAVYCRSTEF